LIDGKEICFEVSNPMETGSLLGLIYFQDSALAVELEKQMAAYWEGATPFDPTEITPTRST
jgi:hypothetical protein